MVVGDCCALVDNPCGEGGAEELGGLVRSLVVAAGCFSALRQLNLHGRGNLGLGSL